MGERDEWFKVARLEPVDIARCREQLSLLIKGYFGKEHKADIRIPVGVDDADVILHRALDELERLRDARNSSVTKEGE